LAAFTDKHCEVRCAREPRVASAERAAIDTQKIDAFARLINERLDTADTNIRKDYIRSIVDAGKVDAGRQRNASAVTSSAFGAGPVKAFTFSVTFRTNSAAPTPGSPANIRVQTGTAPRQTFIVFIPEQRPTPREIVATDEGERLLACYLLRRSADRVICRALGDRAEVHPHYDH
jgi:hypothetical protein